jgi:D-3-phosphoglycerate dehydrogenase
MSPGRDRVLITCGQMQNCYEDFRPAFEERAIEVVLPPVVQLPSEDELIALIGGFHGMIAGDDPLTARVLEHARRMRIISKWGVGTDGIDREAARIAGIRVTNTPAVFGDEVADVALAYVVILARQLHRLHASITSGGWLKHEGRSLAGKTLGVAGFGSIGRAVCRRATGFGLQVIAHDVTDVARHTAAGLGIELVERGELFARSDFLVLCCPLTAETRHLVDERTLGLMEPASYVVNVARGPLVDEAALAGALASGQLAAAALDVFEQEPLPQSSPLRAFEQCVFGSHNGSNTREAVLRASALAVDNLFGGLRRP